MLYKRFNNIYRKKMMMENFQIFLLMTLEKNIPRMIYAKNGILLNDNKNKKFLLFDGKVINIEKSKINTFNFDQINFNLKDYSSNSIIAYQKFKKSRTLI